MEQNKIDANKIYTTHEASKFLYVTPTTLIQWIKKGEIKVFKTLGGHRRIKGTEIIKLLGRIEGNETT